MVENARLLEMAGEVIRSSLRTVVIYKENHKRAIDQIADVIGCISIDRKKIYNEAKATLRKHPSGLPGILRPIFRIFGLDIVVSPDYEGSKFHGSKNNMSDIRFIDDFDIDNLLKLDARSMARTVGRIVQLIAEQEQSDEAEKKSLHERFDSLRLEYENVAGDLRNQIGEYKERQENLVKDVQYYMGILGRDDKHNLGFIENLLNDMELTAIWPEECSDADRKTMFTVLRSEHPGNEKAKPCIMSKGEVYRKGLLFVRVD